MLFFKQFFIFLLLISIITVIDYFYVGAGCSIGIDDGNIFLNYAQHIAHGQGFIFNTNDEKVEGFTSLLWVLICTVFYLITVQPEHLLICFSLVLTGITITVVYRAIKKDAVLINAQFAKKYLLWVYCLFIILLAPSYITWSVLSLMENAVWNLLFTGIILMVIQTYEPGKISVQKKITTIILSCLLILTRPEAIAWNFFFTCLLLFTFYTNNRKLYYPFIYFIFCAATVVGLTFFRLQYFGFPLPNTYYAKISPDKLYNITEGLKYALNFLIGYQPVISFLFVLMITILVLWIYYTFIKKDEFKIYADGIIITKACLVSTVILVGILLPCTTGGDHFGGFRFYQELLPLFAWAIIIILWLIKEYQAHAALIKKISFITVIVFLLMMSMNDLIDERNPAKTQLDIEFRLAKDGRELAENLNNIWKTNKPSVGAIAVGGFGLIYKGTTIDLMGLNNTMMGHSPGDRIGIKNHAAFNKDIFYTLTPDIILPESMATFKQAGIQYESQLDTGNFNNQAMKNIFNDTLFQKKYYPVFVEDKKTNFSFFGFADINFLRKIEQDKNLILKRVN